MAAVAMRRGSARGSRFAAAAVTGFGKAVGAAVRGTRLLPGLGGAAAVSYGIAGYDWRAGLIAGGLFLLAIDRNTPSRSGG